MFDFDFDELGSSDDAQEAVANVTEDPSKMSVRQLKEALAAAGLSCAGATEKDDLVRLLTKTRVQAAACASKFEATAEWRPVPEGVALPPGLEVRFDMREGKNWARLPPAKAPQVVAANTTPVSPAKPVLAKRGGAAKPKEPKRRPAPAQRSRAVVDDLALLAAQEAQQAAERQAAVLARMGSSAARPPWTAAAAPPWTAASAPPQAPPPQARQAAQFPASEAPSAPSREAPPAARPPAAPAAAQRQAEQYPPAAPRAPAARTVAPQPAPAPPAPPPARQVLERPKPRGGMPRGRDVARAAAAETAVELWTEGDRRRAEQAERPPGGPARAPGASSAASAGGGTCAAVGPPSSAGPPPMRFAVEVRVPVRSAPGSSAPVCGGCVPGQSLVGIEETFDGWVRLADDSGWVFRGDGPDGPALLPLGDLWAALAEPELSPAPGRQMFEVVDEEGVPVFREAAEDALALGRRSFGEFVLAEGQSYHGWLRLADDDGWAPCCAPHGGRLLQRVRPDELQLAVPGTGPGWPGAAEDGAAAAEAAREAASRREALRQLEEAAAANSAVFFAALATARDHGVEKRDIARCHALRSSMGL